jgi:N-acetylglutamate synthase-like GNAT family acetyltransferase
MSSTPYQVRRATLEDLPALTALWQSMRFETDPLARHVTDFQVAVDAQNTLLGCLAIQINSRHGLLHSEAFTDFGLAETLRELLWQRMNSVATNHGLLRLWTREEAPFWSRCGLESASEETLKLLPEAWRGPTVGWLTLKLKDDLDTAIASVDKEFAIFMQLEKDRTKRLTKSAKVVKTIIIAVLIIALLGVLIWASLTILHNAMGPRR